jgi:hypothetical protein
MTADDLSPMLSQPADDNAPMISGRGTKVIADARGAYIVRDLRGLLWRMDDRQILRFREAFVRQAVGYAERQIDFSEHPNERDSLALIHAWLDQPTGLETHFFAPDSLEDHLSRYAARFRFHQATSQHAYYALRVIHALTIRTVGLAAWQPVFIAPPNATRTHQQIAHRWQIEAAWAILQGKQPPPIPAH